jgi:pimeloyl-ACP methyl ester carboxylesterase
MGCEAPICVDANVRSAQVGTDRETVVLLHGSASSSALWRHTKGALQSRYRCIAPDLIGYGSSAAWPQQAAFGLGAELRAIEPLLQCCADTFHLVGRCVGVAPGAGRTGTGPVPHVDRAGIFCRAEICRRLELLL